MKILKLISLSFLSLNLTAEAVIINVPAQYSSIQSAINASSNGDTVLVQPGTYFENVIFRGKNIVLTSKFYQNNDYSIIGSTIINGSAPAFPDTASCVLIIDNEDSTTVLQGFTLTGGSGTKWTDEHGAGLFREGGGVLVAYSSPVIQNNIISSNHAIEGGVFSTGGGGMRIGDCYCRVFNNIITNNSARYGAGIVLNYAGGEYRNNVIFKNFGSRDFGSGSAMWLNNIFSRPKTIENNTLVLNTAITGTAGIYGAGSPAIVRNNIVWKNTSTTSVQISGSGLQVRYCDVQGGFSGAGNINVDPDFDSTNYYLKSTSPCIDKGDSSLIYNDPEDPVNPGLAKWPSRGTVRNDIGAYGGPGCKVIANTVVGINNLGNNLMPDGFNLKQNFPNPFNPVTKINYTIPSNVKGQTSNVKLTVYNSIGQEVATLINESKPAGNYSIKFDGSGFSSGIYFYRLESGEFTDVKRMVLVK